MGSGYGNTTVYLLKISVWTNRTAVLPYTYILALCFFFALIPLYIKSIQTNKDTLFNQFRWNRVQTPSPPHPVPCGSFPSRTPPTQTEKALEPIPVAHMQPLHTHTVTFHLGPHTDALSEVTTAQICDTLAQAHGKCIDGGPKHIESLKIRRLIRDADRSWWPHTVGNLFKILLKGGVWLSTPVINLKPNKVYLYSSGIRGQERCNWCLFEIGKKL